MSDQNARIHRGLRPEPARARLFAILVAIFIGVAPALPAGAQSTSASVFVQNLGDKAIGTLRSKDMALHEREAAFHKLLTEGFDLKLIGRFALGRYWRRTEPEKRQDYLELFSQYVLRTYSSRLGGYAGEKLVVVSERPLNNKKDVYVKTRIERPSGPPIKATWRVRNTDGRLRVIDIIIEGISMAVTQRDEFAAVMRRNGIDGLLEVLRARAAKSTATANNQ